MLERQGLVLGPWGPAGGAGGAGPRRPVLDAATGERLGFFSRAEPGPRWLRWLLPVVLEAYETEDASLLCSVRGPALGRRGWEVCDSEGRRVGVLVRTVLLDADG